MMSRASRVHVARPRRLNAALCCALVAALVLSGVAVAQTAQTAPADASAVTRRPRAILADGSRDEYWLAHVRPPRQPGAAAAGGAGTDVLYRQSTGTTFDTVLRLPGRAVSLAGTGGRAAVVLDDGAWWLLWPDGSSTGVPLPGRAKLLAVAGDDGALYGLARVEGGLPAARATTQPTNGPAVAPVASDESAAFAPPPPADWVVYRLDAGGWTPVADAGPAPEPLPPQSVALAVANGKPRVAIESAGDVRVQTGDDLSPHPAPPQLGSFGFVRGSDGPVFWTADEAGAALHVRPGQDPVRLSAGGDPSSERAVVWATGFLRLLSVPATDPGKVVEQKYEWDGRPAGEPTPLAGPGARAGAAEAPWWVVLTETSVLVALVYAVVASFRRREQTRAALESRDRPVPAPLGVRFAAGLIDALPVLVGWLVVAVQYGNFGPSGLSASELSRELPRVAGIPAYVLYTTLWEVAFGRTIGKALLGLKVVGIDGKPVTRVQLLTRNLLRLIDVIPPLTLLLVFVSPFRQRAADAAAGTVVVAKGWAPAGAEMES